MEAQIEKIRIRLNEHMFGDDYSEPILAATKGLLELKVSDFTAPYGYEAKFEFTEDEPEAITWKFADERIPHSMEHPLGAEGSHDHFVNIINCINAQSLCDHIDEIFPQVLKASKSITKAIAADHGISLPPPKHSQER